MGLCGAQHAAHVHRLEFVLKFEGMGCNVDECDMGLD